MTPTKTVINGREYWKIDLRRKDVGRGRIFARTKEGVLIKLRRELTGWSSGEIEFDASDRLAKHELAGAATLLDCVRFYKAHNVTGKKKLLSDAILECVADKKRMNLRAAYTSHMASILNQFSRFVGEVNCDAISTQHVKNFLFGSQWTHCTRTGVRNRLSALFGWCVQNGYLRVNPALNVPLGRAEKVVPKILTVEQVHRLLDCALILDPVMLPYFTLGIFCGIRPEELERLPDACVKIERGIVDIPADVSKTRDRRIVELSENAKVWLTASQKKLRYVRRRFRWIVDAAKVQWSNDVMRHTFASYHLEFHGSADRTAMQMGHQGSTRMLYRHYKATVEPDDAKAFWRIEPAILPRFIQ